MSEEKFAIPGAGGIITRIINNEEYILLQERVSKIREMIKNRNRFYPMQIAALEEYLLKHNKQGAAGE